MPKLVEYKTMAFLIIISLILIILTLVHYHKQLCSRPNKLPPGPIPLPIIGSLHLLGSQPHKSLARLAETYGPIMLLRLGQGTTVVISKPEMAKQVLQKQDMAFSSRTPIDSVQALKHVQNSVVFLPAGSMWRSLRKIMSTSIFSGNRLDSHQDLRSQKVEELILYCKNMSQNGESVDIGQAAFRTTLNLLSNTIFSRDLTDPFSDSATEFKGIIRSIMVEAGKPNLADYFPFLKKMDPQGIRRRQAINFGKLFDLFSRLIDERLEQYKSSGVVANDVLDILLCNIKDNSLEINRTHVEHLFLVCTRQIVRFFCLLIPLSNSNLIVWEM